MDVNLLIVIPGYGDVKGNINTKKFIIDKNLSFFLKPLNEKSLKESKIIIKQFNCSERLYSNSKFRDEITVLYENTGLSEFLYEHIRPELVNQFDYVILILDDVEIVSKNITMKDILKAYEETGVDILSPSVSNATWPYMNYKNKKKTVRVLNTLEFYCYLMKPVSYQKYYKILKPYNFFMWGYDLVLSYANIKAGIYDEWKSYHHFRDYSDQLKNGKAQQNMQRFLNDFFPNGRPYNLFSNAGTLLYEKKIM